jgi:uncharacterized membrane protein YdjX (TVP38/TMEM64 family)
MSPGTRRTLLLTLLAAGTAALALYLLNDLVTLEELKQRRQQLLDLIAERPVAFTSLYFIAFAVIAAFSPGTSLFKVAAGAVFGLAAGFPLALGAALSAAVIGFVTSRYLARGWAERRFAQRVEIVNRGVAQEGVVFLLALRFNPLVPFILINFVAGLTRMRLWVFALTSFFGLIPATFVYTNAGTELARITTTSDLLNVRLLGSLVLLSLMPLAGRWAAKALQRRRTAIADLTGER